MSREIVELAMLMYECFNRRDLDRLLALMHDEVEIEPRFGALEGDYRGHEGVRRWWTSLLDFLPDYVAEVEQLDDAGDMTLLRIRGTAHGAASWTPVLETWWQVIRWRDGKCIWWRNFATAAEAVEAMRPETG
ncbi:MAG: nuclear transport factor 2 family protein [Actinobacteria bacterium]|nr:MAG: nuclear transport factor 2 family protein [Actinomycetota bacterium]